jgi:hypothetical protein
MQPWIAARSALRLSVWGAWLLSLAAACEDGGDGTPPLPGTDGGPTDGPVTSPDGGSPDGAGGSEGDGPAPTPASPRIAFSEIMYHPVLANDDDNDHEFIELHNPGATAVSLAGWQIQGEVRFGFPAGSTLAAGQYLVVARNRARLLELPGYDLQAVSGQVLGDYQGALDDGGGRLLLLDDGGATVDAAVYDDEFPWPLAADAFGAGDGWFQEGAWFAAGDPRRDFAAHRHRGHSLERVSFSWPADEAATWDASPLDRATPARERAQAGAPAVVDQLVIGPQRDPSATPIRASDAIVVRARLAGGPARGVQLEYRIEYERGRPAAPNPPVRMAMTALGADSYQVVLPALPARTLLRVWIVADGPDGAPAPLSPRPSDPNPRGHPVFVSADVAGRPHYEILVTPENWGRMWTHVSPDGAVLGCPSDYLDEPCQACQVNPLWNARVPAVFIAGGQAYDVRARYQGSMEGRLGADDISDWPADLPRPAVGPLRAMSWSLALPRYRRFEGQSRLLLNRLQQSCPGFSHALAAALHEDERGGRVPAPRVRRWARVFIDGGPYNYMMDVEPIGEDYLRRFHGKGQPVGEVYKLFSTGDDHGPWAAGFGQEIEASPFCPDIPVRTRYERTYQRETYGWRPIDELMTLMHDFAVARDGTSQDVRAFLMKNFDVAATLKYYAVQQWGAPWDDYGKNYNIYKLPPQAARPGGGAFSITSWDVDRMFGVLFCESDAACARADIPVHCGTDDLPSCNRWKRAFIDALRPEYDAKLRELNETLFQPANIKRIVDETLARYDAQEADQMANSPSCDATVEAAQMKRFADRRYQAVRRQLGY